jgi:hypothetical protein
MWARVHKVDRIRPQPGGGAIVLVEDDRNQVAMERVAGLTTLIAIARILNARRVLEAKFAGKGEVRYTTIASPPTFLLDAITRAGASLSDSSGERVIVPPAPAAIAPIVDSAFAQLAHHVRTNAGAPDMATAIRLLEIARRKAPLDREANPAVYWTAVFELAALAGELSRSRGGRWIETTELPVPFAIKFASGELAVPTKLAQQIVEGTSPDESLAVASSTSGRG